MATKRKPLSQLKPTIAKRFYQLRVDTLRMSQEELAEKLDVVKGSISNIECGVQCVRLETLAKVSRVAKIPLSYFTEGF